MPDVRPRTAPRTRPPLTRRARGLVLPLAVALVGAAGVAPAAAAPATISGQVTLAGGAAGSAEGMTVYARSPRDGDILRTTQVDAAGRYSLEVEPPVQVQVVPGSLGVWGGSRPEWAAEYYGGAYHRRTATAITTGGDGYDVELDVGGRVSGRVRVPEGDRPERWLAYVWGAGPVATRPSSPFQPVRVNPDGTWSAQGLGPGPHEVFFMDDDESLVYWDDASTPGRDLLDVALGQVVTGIDVGARWTARLFTSDTWSVAGSPVPLRVDVTAPHPEVPVTGELELRLGDEVLSRAPIARGTVELAVPDLPVGVHLLEAHWAGDANFDGTLAGAVAYVDEASTPLTVTGATVRDAFGATGGRRVDVEGSGFTSDVRVTVAGREVEATVTSDTRVATWLPDTGAAGRVPVVVTATRGGAEVTGTTTLLVPEVVAVRPERRIDTPWGRQACAQVTGAPVGRTGSGAFVNVTVSGATAPGYVVVQPDDGSGAPPLPGGSTVNLEPGVDTANATFVPLGPDGKVCVTPVSGAPVGRMLLDVTAYAVGTSGVVGVPSTRLLDTRPGGTGEVDGPVRPRTLHTVQVAGRAGVPADARAVLLNVTTTRVAAPGNLRVFPAGRTRPTETSTVNYVPGKDKANGTLVQLVDGKVSFWSDSGGSADVLLDVIGYTPAGSTLTAVPEPTRVLDTRPGTRTGPLDGPLPARTGRSLPVAGVGGVPVDATAVVLNVTVTGATGIGNLRVHPDTEGDGSTTPPDTSVLNYVPGRDVPNQVVVALPPSGRVALWSDTDAGPVDVVADVVGYVTAPTADD
ncbi:IPT/TIG domain-containing protein [Cellulomonas sp. 179-A 9B4 NHS]|uniref:IPT/TIG domain-containing protein n=1 Tax=Cellulomonas sp. 179-A 9B4 NHS TaxID=3142379 RepID=UPI0039A05D49